MSTANLDPMPTLNGWLTTVSQNYWTQWLLIHFGVVPTHFSFEILFNRLVDVGVVNINFVNLLALVAAILYVITQMVRTIVRTSVDRYYQHHILHRLWCNGGRSFDILPLSAVPPNQHHTPTPDVEFD